MMKKYIILFLVILSIMSLSSGETVPLIIQGKEVKGENLDGLIVYIAKIIKIEELPLYSDFSIKPEGTLFLFEVYFYNRSNKEITLTHENFKLIDDDGRNVSVSTIASIYYALKLQEVFFRKAIKPEQLVGGYLIFELNKNNVPYKLIISDIPEKGKNYSLPIKI